MATNHPNTALSYEDLGKRWGLASKFFVFQHIKDYLDTVTDGSGNVYDITRATADFPFAVAYYTALGWTPTEILDLTLFTICYNESVLAGGNVGSTQHRTHIIIPPGKWWFNSELLLPQGTVRGCGSSWNFGSGGTWLIMDSGTFKSIFDYGVTERHGFVSQNMYGTNWWHNAKIIDIHLTGDCGDYNDASYLSNGIFIQSPGETCVTRDCFIESWNNYGYASYLFGAPTRVLDCSFFYNGVAGVGILDGALGVISVERPSGDQNPVMVQMAHWDHPENSTISIGGHCTIIAPKIEAYPPLTGLAIYGSPGKGQMLFWFEGEPGGANTHSTFDCIGGQAFCNAGYMESLVRVNNYNIGVLQRVTVKGLNVMRYLNFLHDTTRNRKYTIPGWFQQVGGPYDTHWRFPEFNYNVPEFIWNSTNNDLTIFGRSTSPIAVTPTVATCDILHGPQEQHPGSGWLPVAQFWNPNNCASVAGIDPVTGIPYP